MARAKIIEEQRKLDEAHFQEKKMSEEIKFNEKKIEEIEHRYKLQRQGLELDGEIAQASAR